jgi:hypothetical protein
MKLPMPSVNITFLLGHKICFVASPPEILDVAHIFLIDNKGWDAIPGRVAVGEDACSLL